MSLTSHLGDSTSPVRRHVEFVAAGVASLVQGSPLREPVLAMLGLDSLPRGCKVGPVPGANGGTVGAAFDYRLRYHLAPCRSREFVAAYALRLSPRSGRFFADLDRLAERLAPAGRRLEDDDERLLCRYCIVLALLEAGFRAGPRYMPDLSVEDPLTLAPEPAVADLMNLSRSAEAYFRPMIELVTSRRVPYEPNPVFAGSLDVGGADADMIIGDALMELKVTKTLAPATVRDALLQLVGYALLDYADQYAIRKVGVYFPRQEFMLTWPLWTLVFPLADVVRTKAEPSEVQVRERLARLRDPMHRAATGTVIDYEAEFAPLDAR